MIPIIPLCLFVIFRKISFSSFLYRSFDSDEESFPKGEPILEGYKGGDGNSLFYNIISYISSYFGIENGGERILLRFIISSIIPGDNREGFIIWNLLSSEEAAEGDI